MQSLREKMTDMQIELKRESRREKDAAGSRINAILREAFGSRLEEKVKALSSRLLAETATAADRKLLAMLPAADLTMLNTTGPQWIVLMATIFEKY